MVPSPQSPPHAGRRARWRWVAYPLLAVVLALGFWGYTTPDMMLNWETLMALCGFN